MAQAESENAELGGANITLSNSQITKLGDRLRNNELNQDDLEILDLFRQTFSDVDEQAYKII